MRDNAGAAYNISCDNTSQNVTTEEIFIKSEHGDIIEYEEDKLDCATDEDTDQYKGSSVYLSTFIIQ